MRRFLPWLCAALIRVLGATVRVREFDHGGVINKPDHPPVIIAFWHNRIFMAMIGWFRYCRPRRALTFISRSRDGQFVTDVAARFGVQAVRGSSSRHGVSAALAAIRQAGDDKLDIVITPDGPRGPRHQIQPGLIRLAQATQRPIVTVTTRLRWKYTLKSWDRFQIPLPFSACDLITGEPVVIPIDASDEELEGIMARLAEGMGAD